MSEFKNGGPRDTNLGRCISENSFCYKRQKLGTSLVVQWVRLCVPNAGVLGSIPGQGTRSQKIPRAATKNQHSHINK